MPATNPYARGNGQSCPQGSMDTYTSSGCDGYAGHTSSHPEDKKVTRSLVAYDKETGGWVWGLCRFRR